MGLRMLEATFITSHTKACVFNHDFYRDKELENPIPCTFPLREVCIVSRLYVMYSCVVHRNVFVHRYVL